MVSSGKSAWIIPHAVLRLGLVLVLFPVYIAFVASSCRSETFSMLR